MHGIKIETVRLSFTGKLFTWIFLHRDPHTQVRSIGITKARIISIWVSMVIAITIQKNTIRHILIGALFFQNGLISEKHLHFPIFQCFLQSNVQVVQFIIYSNKRKYHTNSFHVPISETLKLINGN